MGFLISYLICGFIYAFYIDMIIIQSIEQEDEEFVKLISDKFVRYITVAIFGLFWPIMIFLRSTQFLIDTIKERSDR